MWNTPLGFYLLCKIIYLLTAVQIRANRKESAAGFDNQPRRCCQTQA